MLGTNYFANHVKTKARAVHLWLTNGNRFRPKLQFVVSMVKTEQQCTVCSSHNIASEPPKSIAVSCLLTRSPVNNYRHTNTIVKFEAKKISMIIKSTYYFLNCSSCSIQVLFLYSLVLEPYAMCKATARVYFADNCY